MALQREEPLLEYLEHVGNLWMNVGRARQMYLRVE